MTAAKLQLNIGVDTLLDCLTQGMKDLDDGRDLGKNPSGVYAVRAMELLCQYAKENGGFIEHKDD